MPKSGIYPPLTLELPGDIQIESGFGGVDVGHEDKVANADGKRGENMPADKADMEDKQLPFMPLHQLLGAADGLHNPHLRVLGHEIGGHRVRVGGNDAGNAKEKGPQKGEKAHHKAQAKCLEEDAEAVKDSGKGRNILK